MATTERGCDGSQRGTPRTTKGQCKSCSQYLGSATWGVDADRSHVMNGLRKPGLEDLLHTLRLGSTWRTRPHDVVALMARVGWAVLTGLGVRTPCVDGRVARRTPSEAHPLSRFRSAEERNMHVGVPAHPELSALDESLAGLSVPRKGQMEQHCMPCLCSLCPHVPFLLYSHTDRHSVWRLDRPPLGSTYRSGCMIRGAPCHMACRLLSSSDRREGSEKR